MTKEPILIENSDFEHISEKERVEMVETIVLYHESIHTGFRQRKKTMSMLLMDLCGELINVSKYVKNLNVDLQ